MLSRDFFSVTCRRRSRPSIRRSERVRGGDDGLREEREGGTNNDFGGELDTKRHTESVGGWVTVIAIPNGKDA